MAKTLQLAGGTRLTGESAYEIAVRNGFEGTEEEWLDSLVDKAEIVNDVINALPTWKGGSY